MWNSFLFWLVTFLPELLYLLSDSNYRTFNEQFLRNYSMSGDFTMLHSSWVAIVICQCCITNCTAKCVYFCARINKCDGPDVWCWAKTEDEPSCRDHSSPWRIQTRLCWPAPSPLLKLSSTCGSLKEYTLFKTMTYSILPIWKKVTYFLIQGTVFM